MFSVNIHFVLVLFNIYLHSLNNFIRYCKEQPNVLNYLLITYHTLMSNTFHGHQLAKSSGGQCQVKFYVKARGRTKSVIEEKGESEGQAREDEQ